MNRKAFLAAYFLTLIVSVAALAFLSWLLIQSLNRTARSESQLQSLTTQLKIAQEAVKRFEARQDEAEEQERAFDELESKYLASLAKNQEFESQNIAQEADLKRMREANKNLAAEWEAKLKDQRQALIREHAERIREFKRLARKERVELMKRFAGQKEEMARRLKTGTKEGADASALNLELNRLKVENASYQAQLETLRQKSPAFGTPESAAAASKAAAKAKAKEEAVQKAHAAAAEVERLKRENAVTHYNLGVTLLKTGRYDQALKEFKYSLGLNPGDPLTHYNLGYIYDSYVKDFDKAVRHYQNYLRLNPQASDAREVEELLLKLRMRKEVGVDGVLKKVGK